MARYSTALLPHIRQTESLRLSAYKCPAGVWSIGYGHTLGVRPGMVIDESRAEEHLNNDVEAILGYLNRKFPWLNYNQNSALIDFIYNVGVSKFETSTLKKKIEARESDDEVCKQFRRWQYYHQGQELVPSRGLLKRREWECAMWKGEIV